MNIVFFSSSAFSLPAFKSISDYIRCVVTKRAKPKGRGYMLEDSMVKQAAEKAGIPVIEIDSFKDPSILQLKDFSPDLFVVVSFGLIVPRAILDLPAIGAINVHPSLLPLYRGPSPMQWALLNGDRQTGITLIRMNEKMDAGDIIYQEKVLISKEDNMITLSERLSNRVGVILPDFINDIFEKRIIAGVEQKHENATYTPLITKDMGRIDWHAKAEQINNKIRAFVVWPTAFTFLDEKSVKIYAGECEKTTIDKAPGTIFDINKMGIFVSTPDGSLIIKELQIENRKRMGAYNFAMGYRGLYGKIFK